MNPNDYFAHQWYKQHLDKRKSNNEDDIYRALIPLFNREFNTSKQNPKANNTFKKFYGDNLLMYLRSNGFKPCTKLPVKQHVFEADINTRLGKVKVILTPYFAVGYFYNQRQVKTLFSIGKNDTILTIIDAYKTYSSNRGTIPQEVIDKLEYIYDGRKN